MATAGDVTAPNATAGAVGKFRKRPLRCSIPAKPYDRPLKNNNPSMLKKLVDPASKLVFAGVHKVFDVFRKRLPPLSLQRPPGINEEPKNAPQEDRRSDSSAKTAAGTGISEIEQMLQEKTFARSEVQRLTSLLHSRTTESPSGDSLEKHRDVMDNCHAAILTPNVTSKVLEEIASPAEQAKSYMGSRGPTNHGHIQDSRLIQRTPITAPTQKTANSLRDLENGFVTPRSRRRSAIYTMAHTPYTRSPIFSQKGIRSDYCHGAASTSSQSALGHEGKMALKRSSSVLDDVIGSGGPLRRIRQKANVPSQRDKKEVGYTVSQQDGSSQNLLSSNETEPKVLGYASVPAKSTQTANKILQHLETPGPQEKNEKNRVSSYTGTREKSPNKLTLDMLHGQALRSLEKADAPKFLSGLGHIQKQEAHSHTRLHERTSELKDKTEENGSRKFPVPNNMLTSVNGDSTNSLKDKAPIVGPTDFPSKVQVPPQKKRAFQLSAPESSVGIDDEIHNNGHMSFPFVKNNKPKIFVSDVIKPPAVVEVSKTLTLVENNNPSLPEVAKVSEQAEIKEAEKATSFSNSDAGFPDGSVREQGLGFKIPISSPSTTTTHSPVLPQSTLQMEKIAPENALPAPISADKPLELKLNSSPDPVSVNGNGNDHKSTNIIGRSVSSFPAVPVSGSFLFDTATKKLSAPNMTPASNPAIFSSLAPFSAPTSASTSAAISTTATTSISTTTVSTTISTATITADAIFTTSVPPPVFSFGSVSATAPTTSMAETGNTSNGSPFAATSFATTTTTTTSATSSSLFGFSSPAATLTSTSQSQGSFFNITNGSQTKAQASSSSTLFDSSVPAFGLSPSFDIGSFGPSSNTNKSGNSTSGPTTSIFAFTWQQPPKSSGFSSTFSSPSSSVFTFGASSSTPMPSFVTGGATNSSFADPSSFRNSTLDVGAPATSPSNTNSNDHMSMEDNMAEDCMQTNNPVSLVRQASVGAPGFMFSSATPTLAPAPTPTPNPAVVPFQFDVQSNQAPPPQNPFQSSSVDFNAVGGSFSLGSGGEKSNRRIVRVVRSKRKK